MFQITSEIISLLCTNVTGILLHSPKEKAQRKAFLETRQCVEARLKIQRENQQQEQLLLSVLPRHVAMEMKNDIAGQPKEAQFHKVTHLYFDSFHYDLQFDFSTRSTSNAMKT